jgi:SAM-dependent methyltransferase
MARPRTLVLAAGAGIAAGAALAALAVARHLRGMGGGVETPGGIVMRDADRYDLETRLLLGPLFRAIAADIASAAPTGGIVLEVGCGPGHLSTQLARDHGLVVTGLDLDPAMIERARATAGRLGAGVRAPDFVVGDVASLPFPDGSFDLVVSTMSLHHWADATAGLTEIARVLRPEGRALVWDIRPGAVPFHAGMPDPLERTVGAPLRVANAGPWRWPWRLKLLQRIELVPLAAAGR